MVTADLLACFTEVAKAHEAARAADEGSLAKSVRASANQEAAAWQRFAERIMAARSEYFGPAGE